VQPAEATGHLYGTASVLHLAELLIPDAVDLADFGPSDAGERRNVRYYIRVRRYEW